jgi:hypothetical protein
LTARGLIVAGRRLRERTIARTRFDRYGLRLALSVDTSRIPPHVDRREHTPRAEPEQFARTHAPRHVRFGVEVVDMQCSVLVPQ